ncbi:MAG TPA: hypothetical protein VNJ04_09785 [Gemmatimonadaceae bacterium]|nr:hypothetical protein [Gemmatimonadaceae bacterium]
MIVTYKALRPVRLIGVDYAAGDTVDTSAVKEHVLAALLRTGKVEQVIVAGDPAEEYPDAVDVEAAVKAQAALDADVLREAAKKPKREGKANPAV